MDEQQKVLNSPFDLETHKKTFINYYVGEPNEKQLDVLRKFREEGIYIGPTYNKCVKHNTVKERTFNLSETLMKNKGYLDTDMVSDIYEMFSESKKLSLKSVVEWNNDCDRIDYTKDVKVNFRFPIDGITYNDNILNVLPQDIQQCTLTKRTKENRDNFRKFIRKQSK